MTDWILGAETQAGDDGLSSEKGWMEGDSGLKARCSWWVRTLMALGLWALLLAGGWVRLCALWEVFFGARPRVQVGARGRQTTMELGP